MLSSRMNKLNPYVPGEQPKDREYIKINANENPYPPSKKVSEAIKNLIDNNPEKLGLYPDPDSLELHEAIADMLNKTGAVLSRAVIKGDSVEPSAEDRIPFTVTPDMIYTGNGSDEVLSFVFYAFFDSGRKLVCPEHSYSFYPVYCGFYDIPREPVALKSDWTLDTEKMVKFANEYDSGMIFANPNAPTSLALTRGQIKKMLDAAPKNRVFVVDEAYVDFGGESVIPLLKDYKNLVVVRTFSKSFCGAGMRSGYIVADPQLVNAVTTVKNSLNHFPMDAVTQVACVAACNDAAYYVECAKKVCAVREDFISYLKKNGYTVNDSKTNFVFVKKDGLDGKKAYEFIRDNGILVRRFDTPGIEQYLRITIGTQKQMDELKKIMDRLLQEEK
ncbi:MAG: aminotransferase class I/II-fold pyridoxal phosphate-dependent enzyme [Treponema sp.]|uniref:pyridoxal phosphate-dependent aminotransferase n=1 Tax=Treponema sp. TaxID=166 RepID=UPI00298D841E|nr:histidinol-phosphate transaminase [Treponema sp.]MBR5934141.1 aminotransferase class I/II-fold pyridoxal phosphate-dependent enzyme [Treponema sp.]